MQVQHTNAQEAYRPALPSPSDMTRLENKINMRTKSKTQHETPHGKIHKGTQNKSHTRTTALERLVALTTVVGGWGGRNLKVLPIYCQQIFTLGPM